MILGSYFFDLSTDVALKKILAEFFYFALARLLKKCLLSLSTSWRGSSGFFIHLYYMKPITCFQC